MDSPSLSERLKKTRRCVSQEVELWRLPDPVPGDFLGALVTHLAARPRPTRTWALLYLLFEDLGGNWAGLRQVLASTDPHPIRRAFFHQVEDACALAQRPTPMAGWRCSDWKAWQCALWHKLIVPQHTHECTRGPRGVLLHEWSVNLTDPVSSERLWLFTERGAHCGPCLESLLLHAVSARVVHCPHLWGYLITPRVLRLQCWAVPGKPMCPNHFQWRPPDLGQLGLPQLERRTEHWLALCDRTPWVRWVATQLNGRWHGMRAMVTSPFDRTCGGVVKTAHRYELLAAVDGRWEEEAVCAYRTLIITTNPHEWRHHLVTQSLQVTGNIYHVWRPTSQLVDCRNARFTLAGPHVDLAVPWFRVIVDAPTSRSWAAAVLWCVYGRARVPWGRFCQPGLVLQEQFMRMYMGLGMGSLGSCPEPTPTPDPPRE